MKRTVDTNTTRLYRFLFSYLAGCNNYEKAVFLVKIILNLFHGQAKIDRGFSISKNLLVVNLQEQSLTSQYWLRAISNSSWWWLFVSKNLRKEISRASVRYRSFLKKLKSKVTTSKEFKRKILNEDVADVDNKKCVLPKIVFEMKIHQINYRVGVCYLLTALNSPSNQKQMRGINC